MIHLLLVLLFVPLSSLESDLQVLDEALHLKSKYDAVYEHRLDSIRTYADPLALYKAYNSYCYDSALYYIEQVVARQNPNDNYDAWASAKIKLAYVHMSGGRFRECERDFEDICVDSLSRMRQTGYYSLRGHLLYDIAHERNTGYTEDMRYFYKMAMATLSTNDSVRYWNIRAQLARMDAVYTESIRNFNHAIRCCGGHLHSEAIFMSSIAQDYLCLGDSALALHYSLQAAIRDIQSSTKEVMAMQHAAILLHALGYFDWAERCIRSAMEDAQHYHAYHRQLEVGEILPIIDSHQMEQLREKNRRIHTLYACIILLLLAMSAALGMILRKLRRRNRALVLAQDQIRHSKIALEQSNYIKDTFLATLLSAEADHMDATERYFLYVTRCAREKNWNDLLSTPAYIGKMGQRSAFYHRFDTMFLQLYPEFIDQSNRLLAQPLSYKEGLLPRELRIFALMRLGVTSNEQLAHILSCSIATIHTYKAHVYARIRVSKEEFNHFIMHPHS